MELLTILYAMLAALTGFSASESAPLRAQPLIASAPAERIETAAVTVRKLPQAISELGRRIGRAARRQFGGSADTHLIVPPMQVAWIDYGRRHL